MSRDRIALVVVSVGVLVAINVSVWNRAALLEEGTRMYLALDDQKSASPVRGGAVRLKYTIGEEIAERRPKRQMEGRVVVELDSRKVARFGRLYRGGELDDGEYLLRWRARERIRIGVSRYDIGDGEPARFHQARYAEVVAGEDGMVILVGVRDGRLKAIASQ